MKTTRIPRAPSTPWPELAEFLAPFRVPFQRSEGPQARERYLTGLLTEPPNKNCDTRAQVVPGTSEPRLPGLLTALAWDEDDLNRQRVPRLLQLPPEGDGVLSFDDPGFAKQGHGSVGVARQDSGTLGTVGNCQVTVNGHYAARTSAWPVATRLYRPKDWAEDADRRKKAKVPEEVTFRTKPESVLALLDQARAWGGRHAGGIADAASGDPPNFLAGRERRRQRDGVAIRADFAVASSRTAPAHRGDALLARLPGSAGQTGRWRQGSDGWLRGRFVAVRCWGVTSEGRRRLGWRIGERPGRGQTGKPKSHGSNFGPDASLAQMVASAHRRPWVEQYPEEAKGLLGGDQYQGRRWSGVHRHAVRLMLASSFLVGLEGRQRSERARRGRPRRAFSSSAGSAPDAVAGGAPAGGRLAGVGGDPAARRQRTHRSVPPATQLTK